MIYFWSDTHFNHEAIIRYMSYGGWSGSRAYKGVKEMNAALEEKWNSVVGPTDTIYLLGDFGFTSSKLEPIEDIFSRLNGHKHLIIGNHDEKNPKVLKLSWESQERLRVVKEDGHRVVVCHYPLESWPSSHHGAVHLHGHSHGHLKRVLPHRFDVGVDVEEVPRSLQHYVQLSAAQPFEATDHHE